jgi:release factor glutamine methyltransferase
MSLRENLDYACRELADFPAGRLEAEILLAYTLTCSRSFLYANPELELPGSQVNTYRKLVKRRILGEPIAYITGVREFWSLPLRVTPDVLIPRAETELLVETALECIPVDESWRIADPGTGSGAIALALAHERPRCDVQATDISIAALEVARSNAHSLGLERVTFHHGSWCAPLQGQFQLIASNPPYIAHDDPHLAEGDCRFEPDAALTTGGDPLAAIQTIARQAREILQADGWLMLEHGSDQGSDVRKLLKTAGYERIETRCDLEHRERVTLARNP